MYPFPQHVLKPKPLPWNVYHQQSDAFRIGGQLEVEGEDIPATLLMATSDGSASVYVLFGGQGINETHFDEL